MTKNILFLQVRSFIDINQITAKVTWHKKMSEINQIDKIQKVRIRLRDKVRNMT